MSTKSRSARVRSPSGDSYQRAPGSRSAASRRRAGSTSVVATISTSPRRSQPGRWPWTATLPRPTMAPRSTLVKPVRGEHRLQRLVEDGETGQRGVVRDDEGWIEPDHRAVAHGDQAAPQALLIERPGDVLRKRLLGAPVLHQLDTQHQPTPTDLPDGPIFLFQGVEPGEHHPSHPFSVLDEVF